MSWNRPRQGRPAASASVKPLIGVLCCNEVADRPVQTVASRFIRPLVEISGAAALLVPALADSFDADAIAGRLDGLLLTGSRSNVAPWRYGGEAPEGGDNDEQRDEVALALAAEMIEAGKPVFGICRGLQELNVLFGGSLRPIDERLHHHAHHDEIAFEQLFTHRHAVDLQPGGMLAPQTPRRIVVNSVHRQGIDALGRGLRAEAVSSDDGLVEGFSARPCGAPLLAVQWHPEWDTAACSTGRRFFEIVGGALHGTDAAQAASA